MSYVKVNFEGKSKTELLRIKENAMKYPNNEYLVQAISLIDIVLREMERVDSDSSEEETESECESESESEESEEEATESEPEESDSETENED